MINLRITDNREDIRKWTGLSDDELWNVGFNLDDWDICFESDTRLVERVDNDEDGDRWVTPVDEAWWLVCRMENYCCGFNEVKYKGKWYYTVHHA